MMTGLLLTLASLGSCTDAFSPPIILFKDFVSDISSLKACLIQGEFKGAPVFWS